MAGINVGNFWGRMMPGMVNALGQQYGGNLSGASRASSSLLGAKKQPKTPKVTNGIQGGQLPGQQMSMPQIPTPPPMSGGVNTGPTNFNSMGGGHGGFWNPGAKGPLQLEMNGMPIGTMGGNSGGGLFNRYNQMGQTPFSYRF